MPDAHQPGFAKLASMIEKLHVGMLATIDENGNLRSRPMATQRVEGEALWFFANAANPIIAEIGEGSRVNVSYADANSETYVSASGTARCLRDVHRVRELWSGNAQRWFPAGPDDSHIALLRVDIACAEYRDVDTRSMKLLHDAGVGADDMVAAVEHRTFS